MAETIRAHRLPAFLGGGGPDRCRARRGNASSSLLGLRESCDSERCGGRRDDPPLQARSIRPRWYPLRHVAKGGGGGCTHHGSHASSIRR